MRANKYLVISPNSYGNIGDDICAYAGKKAIEIVDPTAQVVVSQPPMKKELIQDADYVVLSGGGILYDRHEPNVDNYMQYIDAAHELGKKSAVLGVGVQGIVTEAGKKRYIESLSKCEFVSVRTEKDRKMLEEAGFKKAVATFDIAYFTPPMISDIQEKRRSLLREKIRSFKKNTKPRVGLVMINLRQLKGDNYGGTFQRFDEIIEDFIEKGRAKYDIYLIQHASEDGKLMKALANKYNINFVPYKGIEDVPAFFRLYESLDFMVGARLHSIALGIMSHIPTVGIGSSNTKQLRLANYGLPTLKKQFITFNDIEKLTAVFEQALEEPKTSLQPLSKDEYTYIEEKNNLNLELIKQMIQD